MLLKSKLLNDNERSRLQMHYQFNQKDENDDWRKKNDKNTKNSTNFMISDIIYINRRNGKQWKESKKIFLITLLMLSKCVLESFFEKWSTV